MKARLIVAAMLALPGAAVATVAMEPLQATPPLHEAPPAHPPLFTVKFILRQPSPDTALPQVTVDQARPAIAPPAAGSVPAALLGSLHQNPNAIICYGRSCESDVR